MPHTGASPRSSSSSFDDDEPATLGTDDEGAALLSAVASAPETFRELFEHERLFSPEVLAMVRSTLEMVERRLGHEELQVVVVGERRSGKSTLLDAIVGDRLLGGARGDLAVVTFLRQSDAPNYRARFTSGKEEEFAQRVPDKASALDRTAEELEVAFAAAQRTCQATRLELGRAHESRGQVETEAEGAANDVEEARASAARQSAELARIEGEAARVELATSAAEQHIPAAVRSAPPRWSLFIWLWYATYLLFFRNRHRQYRVLVGERERARARLTAERDKATEAAEMRAVAEARFQPLDLGAKWARLHTSELEETLKQAEAERARLRNERAELRSEREHLVNERWRRFFEDLTALSKKRDLVELAIDYPAKLLPDDVTLVDIPGMLDDASPAWALIRDRADGCILVSELDRGVSEAAKLSLRRLRDVVPHAILVLTKMDLAYERGIRQAKDDPWSRVEHARRIGTRRFARELGRAPDRVLSVSVAAEALLSDRGSDLAERSERELQKLFVLLRRERALILGAHAARAIRRCIAGITDAEKQAEYAYRDHILELERKRTPEPAAFREELLESAVPQIAEAAHLAVGAAESVLGDGFLMLLRLCEQTIDERVSRREWLESLKELAVQLSAGAATARADAQLELETSMERGVTVIERELFQAVRARYQLDHEIQHATSPPPGLDTLKTESPSFAGAVAEAQAAAAAFRKTRWALGASGVAAGATAGAFGGAAFHPWLGLVVGAGLGGLASLLRRESALRRDALGRFRAALDAQQGVYARELAEREESTAEAIHRALERALERAMIRFAQWIEEPLEAERQALDAEREKLAGLEALRERISRHDTELERLVEAARRASVGLAR